MKPKLVGPGLQVYGPATPLNYITATKLKGIEGPSTIWITTKSLPFYFFVLLLFLVTS